MSEIVAAEPVVAEPAQQRPVKQSSVVARKMVVGASNDPLEADADRIGRVITSAIRSTGPHACGPGCGHPDAGGDRVQRQTSTETPLNPAGGPQGGLLDDRTALRITRASGGEPLSADLRARIEPVVDRDLSDVTLHRRSEVAPEIGAEAFTIGSRIHLGPNAPQPGSRAGDDLLAHELGHVVQNTSARVQRSEVVQRRGHADNLPLDVFKNLLDISPPRRQVKSFRPSTGLGQFDAEYLHGGGNGQLIVTLKPYFEWVQRVKQDNDTKDFIVTPGGWDDAEKLDFIDKFKTQTVAAWQGKYRFRATKAGFESLSASLVIKVEPTTDLAQSHFHHRIQKETDKNNKMATGIGREQNSGAERNIGNFAEADKTERPHDSATTCAGIADHDRTRLRYLMDAFDVNPIRFKNNGHTEISNDSKAKIDQFVAAAKRTERPGSVEVPMLAVGKRNKWEKAGRGDKATARANVVKAYIESKDFKNNTCGIEHYDVRVDAQQAEYDSKRTQASKDYELQKLEPLKAAQYHREALLEVDPNYVFTGDPYSILAHEFGHMLGNPDEYFMYGSDAARDAKAQQLLDTGRVEDAHRALQIQAMTSSGNDSHASAQEAMMRMALDAGVDIPEYGPTTSSIMSAGADVLPAHYLPLREVLGHITGDTLSESDWDIV